MVAARATGAALAAAQVRAVALEATVELAAVEALAVGAGPVAAQVTMGWNRANCAF